MARTKKIKEQEVLVDEDLVLEDDDLDLNDLDFDDDSLDLDDDGDLQLDDFDEEDEEEEEVDEESNVEEVEEEDLDFDDEEDLKLDDLDLDDDGDLNLESTEEEVEVEEVEEETSDSEDVLEEVEEVEEELDFDDQETTNVEEVVEEEVKEEKPKRGRKKKEEVKEENKESDEIDMDEILNVEQPDSSPVATAKDRKAEKVEDYVEEKVVKPTAKRVTTKELKESISKCIDKKAYLDNFQDKVLTKVRKYESITKARKEGKTDKVPTAKTVGRSDYASLMKAKLYSDEYYVTRFVRLLVSLGLDNEEAVNLVTKGKMSSIAFEELFFGLFTDTLEDVLKAESGVCLLQKDDIRATVEGQYIEDKVQSLEHLIRSNKALKGVKYTHIRKGDYYKVICKSKTSATKLEKGIIDKKGNFVVLEEEK